MYECATDQDRTESPTQLLRRCHPRHVQHVKSLLTQPEASEALPGPVLPLAWTHWTPEIPRSNPVFTEYPMPLAPLEDEWLIYPTSDQIRLDADRIGMTPQDLMRILEAGSLAGYMNQYRRDTLGEAARHFIKLLIEEHSVDPGQTESRET